MKHKSAKLGTLLLNVALGLFWFRFWCWALAALVVVGIIDLVLIVKQHGTISMWLWQRFRATVDAVLMVSVLVTTYFILGLPMAVGVLLGMIVGHLGWQSSDLENGKQ